MTIEPTLQNRLNVCLLTGATLDFVENTPFSYMENVTGDMEEE